MLYTEEKFDKLKLNINNKRRSLRITKPYNSISNTLDKEILDNKPSELAKYIIEKVNYCQSHLKEFFTSVSTK